MRFLLLLLLLQTVLKAQAQSAFPKQFVKVSLVDQSFVTLPTVKLGYGFLVKDYDYYADYAQIDLGYNFYSIEDDLPASGLYVGGKYHFVKYADETYNKGFSLGYSYLNTRMHQYLKVAKSYPGIGVFNEYEWNKFYKRRHTISVEKYHQLMFINGFFFELRYGLSLVDSKINTPKEVTQNTFVNGFSLKKRMVFPGVLIGSSIGYYF
ncbi:MAG: hypothetical protein Q8K70_12680 [Bacteroidota bacterium]|nr:hypothetical protein [Bacteroidota bacterium]